MNTIRQLHILWTLFRAEFDNRDRNVRVVPEVRNVPLRTGNPVVERVARYAAQYQTDGGK